MTLRSYAAIALMVASSLIVTAKLAAAADLAPKKPAAVVVTMAAGEAMRGTLLTLGPESLSLLVPDQEAPIPLALADITRIQTAKDSNRDGAIKGALALGLLCMIACTEGTYTPAEYWGTVVMNTVLGAGIGWGLDALVVSRATIYDKGGRRLAVGASYRW